MADQDEFGRLRKDHSTSNRHRDSERVSDNRRHNRRDYHSNGEDDNRVGDRYHGHYGRSNDERNGRG